MEWHCVVDRIEEKWAIVLVGPNEIKVDIPLELLPAQLKEGDHLRAEWEFDQDSTSLAKERVTSLLEKLRQRSNQ